MKKIQCIILACLCTLGLSAQNKVLSNAKKDSLMMAAANAKNVAAMKKKDSLAAANKNAMAVAKAVKKRDSIMAAQKKPATGGNNTSTNKGTGQQRLNSMGTGTSTGQNKGSNTPNDAWEQPAGTAPPQTEQNGTNKIAYIDNHNMLSTGTAIVPAGAGGASWNAQWTQADNHGIFQEGGKLYGSISYLGDNGKNYQSQIVATPSKDPAKGYDVHFQSRPYGEGEYKEGHVIILDWNKNPWLVKVDYTPAKGIFFTFIPYRKE